jgi:hypothetical protein
LIIDFVDEIASELWVDAFFKLDMKCFWISSMFSLIYKLKCFCFLFLKHLGLWEWRILIIIFYWHEIASHLLISWLILSSFWGVVEMCLILFWSLSFVINLMSLTHNDVKIQVFWVFLICTFVIFCYKKHSNKLVRKLYLSE